MIRLLVIFISLIGSVVQSETIEERLPVCIQQAEELLLKGTRIKEALATDLDANNVNNILEVMFAGEIIEMFNELIERHLEEDATASELQNNLEKVANPMSNRFNYIADMLVEHWDDKGNSAKARYIAGCANNFDGKAETQADQIADLNALNYELRSKINELEKQLKAADLEISRNEVLRDNISELRTELFEANNRLKAANEKIESIEFYTQKRDERKEIKIRDLNTKVLGLEQNVVQKTQLLADHEEMLAHYKAIVLKIAGVDVGLYLDTLLSMSPSERNEELRTGRFSTSTISSGEELKCLSDLRNNGRLIGGCRDILIPLLVQP